MRYLVTGGAGFIGSHLCDRLIAEGHKVICVDNLLTGSKKNITHLLKNSSFTFLEHDCSQPLPDDLDVNTIYHLASPASPPKYQQFAVETLLVNTAGTYYLLEKAKRWRAKFVFASTSEVYGDPKVHPQKETYWGHVNPTGIRACYDEGKRVGEAFVMTYLRKFALDTRIIRIFNTYGPRMDIDDGRVVTNFIKQILEKKPLTIYGQGTQTRSFCYISDLVEGMMLFTENATCRGEIINLGNPQEQTILEFAQVLKELTGYQGDFVYRKLPIDDPQRRQPDITKARQLLGWEPNVMLNEGLELTLEYFKQRS